jgi:hypothetical protein
MRLPFVHQGDRYDSSRHMFLHAEPLDTKGFPGVRYPVSDFSTRQTLRILNLIFYRCGISSFPTFNFRYTVSTAFLISGETGKPKAITAG